MDAAIHVVRIIQSFLSTIRQRLLIFRSALWHSQLIQRLPLSYVSGFLVTPNEYGGTRLVDCVVPDAARLQILALFLALQQYATKAPFLSCRHLLSPSASYIFHEAGPWHEELRCEILSGTDPSFVPPFSHGTFKTSPAFTLINQPSLPHTNNPLLQLTDISSPNSYSCQRGSVFKRKNSWRRAGHRPVWHRPPWTWNSRLPGITSTS